MLIIDDNSVPIIAAHAIRRLRLITGVCIVKLHITYNNTTIYHGPQPRSTLHRFKIDSFQEKRKKTYHAVRQTMILCQYQAQFVDCMLQDISEI